jgi:hypothetical protein
MSDDIFKVRYYGYNNGKNYLHVQNLISRFFESGKTKLSVEFITPETAQLQKDLSALRDLLKKARDALDIARTNLPKADSLPVLTETEIGKCVKTVNSAFAEIDASGLLEGK